MRQRCAVALTLVLAIACGGSNPTPHPTLSKPIEPQTVMALEGGLGQASVAVAGTSPQSALAAQVAALALQANVEATDVSITAHLLATPDRAALTSGTARAFGFQLQLLHLSGSTGAQTFSGVFMFQSGSDWVLVAGPSPGSPIPPGLGLLASGGQLWQANAGQESAQLDTEGNPCNVALPPGVTSCKLATFTNAGFSIPASSPASSGATGSKTASLASGPLGAGVSLIVDCSISSLCPSASGVRVLVSPAAVNVGVGGTQAFRAAVTGTSNSAVTWTVEEAGGGSITSSGLYTAPGATGTFHVRATSGADATAYGRATVTVTGTGITVSIQPAAASVGLHGGIRFGLYLIGTTNSSVTWSVEEAGGGTIDGTGLYAAPGVAGNYHVRATSVADPTAYGRATVTVTNSPPFRVMVTAEPEATGGSSNLVCAQGAGAVGPVTFSWHGYRDDGATTGLSFNPPTSYAPVVTLSTTGTAGSNFYVFCVVTDAVNAVASGDTMMTLSTGDTIPTVTVSPSTIHAGMTNVTFDGTTSMNAQAAVGWTVQYGGNVTPAALEDYLKIPAGTWTTVFTDTSPSSLIETVGAAKFGSPGAYRVQLTVTSSSDYSQNEGTYYFQVLP
jgi:hypothetical protein